MNGSRDDPGMVPGDILLFISSLRTGGAELHALELCRYMIRRGVGVSVCTLGEGGELGDRFGEAGAAVYEAGIGSLGNLAGAAARRRVMSVVESASPDILHAHMYHAEMVAALASRLSGLPLVVTRHSSGLEFNGLRRFAARMAGRWTRRVIAVSGDAAREALRLGARVDEVVTIHNGVDTGRFRPMENPLRESERERLVGEHFQPREAPVRLLTGTVSGLKPVKNLSMMVRAFAALDPAVAGEAGMIITGEGPSRTELEDLVSDLGLEGRVVLPGRTDRPEELLPLLDVFILSSRSEGAPMALLEAMSCGLAIVATRVGAVPELLADCGITVDPGDAGAMTAAIERLANDYSLRAELGRRARVRALEYFDIEIWGERTLQVYRELLRSPR